jgi:type IV pilus assembly protein PilV
MRKLKKEAGIGLIEVLVTIVITTIGLLGLSALQMQSIRSVSDTGNRGHAVWIANDLINRISANEIALANYVTNDELGCNAIPGDLKICASYFSAGAQLAPEADCTNADLAVFDQYDALCGINAIIGEDAFSSSASFINTPGLEINDIGDGDYQIIISWNSKSAGTSIKPGENGEPDEEQQVFYLESGELADNPREFYTVTFRP